MCRGRFSSSLKSADPSLSLLSLCISCFHLPAYQPVLSLLLPLTFTSIHPTTFLFLSPPPLSLTHFTLLVLPSYSYPPPLAVSLGFHSFVLSLSQYSTSLILSLSQWESCRQTEAAYTNVTIFDKTHTHSPAPCTTAQTYGKEEGEVGPHTHVYTPERQPSNVRVNKHTRTHSLMRVECRNHKHSDTHTQGLVRDANNPTLLSRSLTHKHPLSLFHTHSRLSDAQGSAQPSSQDASFK